MAIGFMHAHHRAAYGRAFFTTKSRGYMGLCPTLTREGDRLVIVFGARTPFILRKLSGNRFRLLGECYVHNIMRGEIFAEGQGYGVDLDVEQFRII
jgi:hypothetical protein